MQILQIAPGYIELDPRKKNEEWANALITQHRMNWKPIVDPRHAEINRAYLEGRQGTEEVRAMFADPANANIDFTPKKLMEKIRNIIVGENENEDVEVVVNSIDPSSMQQREADKEMLSNRSDTEEFLSHLGATINMPAFNLENEKKRTGKDQFNGNIKKFDEMGLDEADPEDREHFFVTYYKLYHEAALDSAIRAYLRTNEARKKLPMMCNDIMAIKAVALQTFVDEQNGNITLSRLDPATVFTIPGARPDFKDAVCIGYEEDVTLMQFLRRLGDSFNMDTDWQYLLWAINAKYSTSYSGIGTSISNVVYGDCKGGAETFITYQQLWNYKVGLGYIEWKSIDGKGYKFTRANFANNPRIFRVPVNGKPDPNSTFERKIIYEEFTYKSYFLVIGPTDQKLFKFGRLPYAHLEGSEDEISSYTICAYKEEGPSIIDIAKPHLKTFEKAYAKREYLINKAKESGYAINLDSLVALAEQMTTDNKKVDPMDLLKAMNDSPNMLYSTSQTQGGNGIPITELRNGIIEASKEFRTIMLDCLFDINDQIGISPLRDGYAPQPRDVAVLQQQSLAQSRLATGYINRNLMYIFGDGATRMVSYIQSIIKFKNINPIPYKYLLKLLGDDVVAAIEGLDDVCMHRYGTFVEPFNRKYDKEELKGLTIQAFNNKEISYDQMLLINSIDSPKRAAVIMSYIKRKAEAQAEKMLQMQAQLTDQSAQAQHQRNMELQQLKNQGDIEVEKIRGMYYEKALVGAAEERNQATQTKVAADNERSAEKRHADIELQKIKNETA